ncbi:MAG: PocR ligand-binding domain-containing protein [Desulfarculaceae bacterium]|nr:PocR ligand-binding domain-containing protein [Desulfarculaceae bacterium]
MEEAPQNIGVRLRDEFHISDLINIEQLQLLMEKFTAATDTGTALLDLEGKVLVASGWQDICTRFHRIHPDTARRCHASDVGLANQLEQGQDYNVYRCLNGMVDAAIPVRIQGVHFANLYIGQFLSEKPDLDFFRQQAREFGFEEDEYLWALSRVPILSDEEVALKLDYLAAFAAFLGEAGLDRLNLKKIMHELEDRVEERTQALQESQRQTQEKMQEAVEARRQTERVNRRLVKTKTELERSNRDLQQFAYVASHDLQEPLRMVSSYVQLLQRRYQDKLDQDANDFIAFAVDGAARMKILIQDLLTYSRVTTRGADPKPTESGEALDRALGNLTAQLQENQAEISRGEMPRVTADPSQLTQVFQNLVHNAVKYRREEPPRLRAEARRGENEWIFSLSDNGVGIETQYFDRIFVIYQRLASKAALGGTGIGLALVKKIVERHGGRVWVESTPGQGSTFYFSIPDREESHDA